jgi:hypothetical protein
MMGPIDIGALARQLGENIEPLAWQLFPDGRAEGPEFRIGSTAGEPGRSMAIRLRGEKRGVWCDFASGETGDALDLVAAARFRGEKGPAIAWAREWLGHSAGGASGRGGAPRRPAPRPSRADAAADQARQRHYDSRRALGIWLEGRPELRATPVDHYLKGRGIDLARLGRSPGALRFHPHLRYRQMELYCPAMVALIADGEGEVISIHRTYLEVRADGSVRKADVAEPKLTLGGYKGGAIRLWRGVQPNGLRRPPLKDAQAGETVVLSEGIENGLTIALACPEYRVLAGVSLANLGNVELPGAIAGVILIADNDEGRQAQAGLERAIAAHSRAGRTVRVARAPATHKDFNDYAQALQTGSTAA